MTILARLVAAKNDLNELAEYGYSAIAELNEKYDFQFLQLRMASEPKPELLVWANMGDAEITVEIHLDWESEIAYVDTISETENIAILVCNTFSANSNYRDLEFHIAELSRSKEDNERKLVKIALAAIASEDDSRVVEHVSSAFKSADVHIRRAATFATHILRWEILREELQSAISNEKDSDLKGLMVQTLSFVPDHNR